MYSPKRRRFGEKLSSELSVSVSLSVLRRSEEEAEKTPRNEDKTKQKRVFSRVS